MLNLVKLVIVTPSEAVRRFLLLLSTVVSAVSPYTAVEDAEEVMVDGTGNDERCSSHRCDDAGGDAAVTTPFAIV